MLLRALGGRGRQLHDKGARQQLGHVEVPGRAVDKAQQAVGLTRNLGALIFTYIYVYVER